MGVWRYTTKVINGVCQRVYKFYEVYGPPEHVISAAAACVKTGALVAALAVPVYAGGVIYGKYRPRAAEEATTPASEGVQKAFDAGGFQGFGYTGGGRNDSGSSGSGLGPFSFGFGGSGSGGGYSWLDTGSQFAFSPPGYEGVAPGGSGAIRTLPGFVDAGSGISTQPTLDTTGMGGDTGSYFQSPPAGIETPGDTAATPEPGTLALLGFGVLAMAFICKRIK